MNHSIEHLELEKYLIAFLNLFAHKPAQGSPEWRKERQNNDFFSIGGSEMASFMGVGYDSQFQLLLKKIIGSNFIGNTSTRWGNLFEPLAKLKAECEFNTKIYDSPTIDTWVKYHTFSPDGLAIVGEKLPAVVLFEFKCPFSRRIRHRVVPKYYLPQVLSGLYSLPMTSYGVFIECVFRKTTLEEEDSLEYDTVFHCGDEKKNIVMNHIYEQGVIGFITNEISGQPAIDLGKANAGFMANYLYKFDKHIIETYYPQFGSFSENLNEINQYCKQNNKEMCAFLPWKLFDMNIVQVEKDITYLNDIKPQLIEAAKIVKKGKEARDPRDLLNRWYAANKKIELVEEEDFSFYTN